MCFDVQVGKASEIEDTVLKVSTVKMGAYHDVGF